VRRVFGYVSEDVMAATGRRQEPYLYGRLGGDEVYLNPQAPAGPPPKPAAVPAPQPASEVDAFNPKRAAAPLTTAEERALKPKHSFKECDVCPEMVVVPAGSFIMMETEEARNDNTDAGRRRKLWPHRVTIERPFAVGKFEVTFVEWDACIERGICRHRPEAQNRGRRAATELSWNDIVTEYLPWLSYKTGKKYRMLSEAEWEYAALAGEPYLTGFNFSKRAVDVGSSAPNAFGLYDMHGNGWEWVQDCYTATYDDAPVDGSAWTIKDCSRGRVLRGGSVYPDDRFYNLPAVRDRIKDSPGIRHSNNGFRVARTLYP
jgi:formylglycine-generating enzyme required for sulfatase activity